MNYPIDEIEYSRRKMMRHNINIFEDSNEDVFVTVEKNKRC